MKTTNLQEGTSAVNNGIVALYGLPSSGKSTLLNAITYEKVAITADTPQTTRNLIRGILNTSLGQLVFIDTPGIQNSKKTLNIALRKLTLSVLKEADLILYILDSTREIRQSAIEATNSLLPFSKKVFIAINKIDSEESKEEEVKSFILHSFPALPEENIYSISALKDKGVDSLLKGLYNAVERKTPLFPNNLYTNQTPSFRISEVVRGEFTKELKEDLPYSIYTKTASCLLKENELKAEVIVFVNKESQKGIVIGRGGALINKVKERSIMRLKEIYSRKINLIIRVKVHKNWIKDEKTISKLLEN